MFLLILRSLTIYFSGTHRQLATLFKQTLILNLILNFIQINLVRDIGDRSIYPEDNNVEIARQKTQAKQKNPVKKKEVDVAQRTEDSLNDFKNEMMNFFNEEVVAIKDEITKINKRYNDDQAPVVTPDPIEQLIANAQTSVPSNPVNRVEPAPQLLGIDDNQRSQAACVK